MQLNLVNFLMGTPAAHSANNDASERDTGFAQMLGDANTGNSGQGGKSGAMPGNELSATTLIAQELEPAQLATLQGAAGDKLARLLSQMIGEDEAKALLAKLAEMQNGGEFSDPAFEQLQHALEKIEASGESVEVSDLLDGLPQVADAETPAERAPVLQRLLGWMQAAMDKHKEASSQAALVPDGTAQSLQASLFSAGDDAAQAQAAQDAADAAERKKTAQVTALMSTAAMPEWVKKLGAGEENLASDAINEAIPSLALGKDEEGLPAINLPETFATAAHQKKMAARAAGESFQMLASQANDAPVVQTDGSLIAPLHGVNPNSPGASTPITLSAHSHLAPHTAAAEQVHVAITSMTKDGMDKITLQLEPADLGRVEIKMDMSVEGKTQLSFLVDKPETLDQLARDARSLERALQEAGIKSDAGSMQFNLRQQQEQPEFTDEQGGRGHGANDNEKEAALIGGITKHYTLDVREGVDIHA